MGGDVACDWLAIRNEYINTAISQRKLADKYGVSASVLMSKANKENWKKQKEKQISKIQAKCEQKTADKIVNNEVNRIDRTLRLHDELLHKAEQAAAELNKCIVTNKKRTKTVTYNNKFKVCKEVVTEDEILDIVDSTINTSALKSLTSALKDLKDIAMIDNTADKNITVALSDEVDEWAN